MTRRLIAPLSLGPDALVLDAGCGIGGAAVDLARASACRVLGLTISGRQVEIARERAREAGLDERVSFARCDCAEGLPLEDASVDAILSVEALCHFEDRATFLDHARRVLRPGALFSMSDWMAGPTPLDPGMRAALDDMRDAWFLADFETAEARLQGLRRAGFEVLECEDISAEVEPNARWMMRTAMEMDLGLLAGQATAEWGPRWRRQLFSLGRAFRVGAFTVVRFLARKPRATSR
jgi:tocopherol O-methyltransferase